MGWEGSGRKGSRVTARISATLVTALLAALLAGCGSDDPKAAPSPSASATPDATAAAAEITTAWETFFNPAGTVAAHVALLENGSAFTTELTASSKDPAASDLSAKVTKVEVTSPTMATVTYDLLGKGGTPLLPGAMGSAVLEGSTWKVSKLTYCQLIGLQNPSTTPPGCA